MRCRSLALPSAALLAALALLAPARASAHDNGLYVSLKYGTTDVQASFGDAFKKVVDGDDNSKTIEVGFRFSPHFAIQGGYHDFGDVPGFGPPCSDNAEACGPGDVPLDSETKAYSLEIVPQLPLGKRLSIFVKGGIVRTKSELTDAEGNFDFSEDFDDNDVIYGAGLRFGLFGPLQIFYEYEWIGSDFETQSFGATFQF
jgi:hypothetical protein